HSNDRRRREWGEIIFSPSDHPCSRCGRYHQESPRRRRRCPLGARWRRRGGWVVSLLLGLLAGCSIGPKALEHNRLPYNEAVKTSTEEQLLLNIVRLRYIDTPSSLAVSSIAAQHELVKSLKLVPFFAASGDVRPRPFSTLLPQAELNTADRPTLS